MNLKTSSSNTARQKNGNIISITLIRENLKRFWGISALVLIAYFLMGILPILLNYDRIDDMSNIIQSMLNGSHVPYLMLLYTIPVFTGIFIYRYMQSPSSTAVIHSLPFTRSSLFHSNFISGMILILGPILVNGLILLAIAKPSMLRLDTLEKIDVFTYKSILLWIGLYAFTSFILFALTSFSAVITGSSILQVMLSFGFPLLLPGLLMAFVLYFQQFLYGYFLTDTTEKLLINISPFIKLFEGNGFSTFNILWYVVFFAIVYIAAFFLYKKRNMEKAGDTIAFGFMKPIFKWLAAFTGMTALSFFFQAIGRTNIYMYLGAFLGALIGYIIAEVIVQKSMKIFKHLKGFILYAIVACLFFVVMITDLTGYERKLPDISKVEGVNLLTNDYYSSYEENPWNQEKNWIKDTDTMKEVMAFHDMVIDEKAQFMNPDPDQNYNANATFIVYHLKNGKKMVRSYAVEQEFYGLNPHAKKIYESAKAKELKYEFLQSDFKLPDYLRFEPAIPNTSYRAQTSQGNGGEMSKRLVISNPTDILSFFDAIKRDAAKETFEEANNNLLYLCNVTLTYSVPNVKEDNGSYAEINQDNRITYSIPKTYEHTIAWLQQRGLYEIVNVTPDDFKYVVLTKTTRENSDEIDTKQRELSERDEDTIPQSNDENIVITDKATIAQIMQTMTTYTSRLNEYYTVNLHTTDGYYYTYYYETLPEFIQ